MILAREMILGSTLFSVILAPLEDIKKMILRIKIIYISMSHVHPTSNYLYEHVARINYSHHYIDDYDSFNWKTQSLESNQAIKSLELLVN